MTKNHQTVSNGMMPYWDNLFTIVEDELYMSPDETTILLVDYENNNNTSSASSSTQKPRKILKPIGMLEHLFTKDIMSGNVLDNVNIYHFGIVMHKRKTLSPDKIK
jgi:hypothetical protein